MNRTGRLSPIVLSLLSLGLTSGVGAAAPTPPAAAPSRAASAVPGGGDIIGEPGE